MKDRVRILLAVRRLREERAQRQFERQLSEVQQRKAALDKFGDIRQSVREKVTVLDDYFLDAASTGAAPETVSYCTSWRAYLRQLGLYWDTKKIEAQYNLRRAEKILNDKRNQYRYAHSARERVEHLYQSLVAQEQASAEIAAADQLEGLMPEAVASLFSNHIEETIV